MEHPKWIKENLFNERAMNFLFVSCMWTTIWMISDSLISGGRFDWMNTIFTSVFTIVFLVVWLAMKSDNKKDIKEWKNNNCV